MEKNKVAIIGLGYVGLPLACTIAKNKKYKVYGLDTNKEKIEIIKKKKSPFKDKLTEDTLKKVKLELSDKEEIIKGAEFIIICVPTPVKSSKMPDLRPIKMASQTVKKHLEKGQKIIIESTINPGVCEEIILPILEKSGLKGGRDFELSHCPERINPGDTKWNVENIARNIGSLTQKGNKEVATFYRSFLKGEIKELSCLKAAEATKVIENTFRDINIAYVNELAKSFDLMKIDLIEVIEAASNKPFAFMAHFPGCGVGGHCIPVDPYYLIERAKKVGFNHKFLKEARSINNSMPEYTVELLEKELRKIKSKILNQKIGLLGLTYKADIDDIRESPALEILKILKKKKAKIKSYEPYIPEKSDFKNLEETLKNSDIIIIATNHIEFKKISGKLLKKHNIKIVIDGKNCLNKSEIIKEGIIYKGIGQ
jgi:nucleotide sugar dehydrogenase